MKFRRQSGSITLEDALGLIGKRRAADQFAALVELTREKQPELFPWLAKRPLRALELAEDWPRLLEIVAWLLHASSPCDLSASDRPAGCPYQVD